MLYRPSLRLLSGSLLTLAIVLLASVQTACQGKVAVRPSLDRATSPAAAPPSVADFPAGSAAEATLDVPGESGPLSAQSRNPDRPLPPSSPPGPTSPSGSPPSSTPPPVPQIDRDRLWSTLQALPTPRDTLQGRRQTREWLSQQLRDRGWQVQEQSFSGGVNLVAQVAQTAAQAQNSPSAPPTKIIVAAHYDTVTGSPGFNDNGTGVVGLLEIASLFPPQQAQNYPKALELVFFDLEERGLQGSFAYTQSFQNLANLEAVMVLDMLGYGCQEAGCQTYPESLPKAFLPSDRGNFLAIVGDDEHAHLLDAFDAVPASPEFFVYTLAVPLKGILTPDVLRSDHAPFWLHNIGAILVTDTGNLRNPHYHQPSDTLDNLDRPFFERSLQASIIALHQWLSPEPPPLP